MGRSAARESSDAAALRRFFGTSRSSHKDFLNLHEVFLNAELQHRWWKESIEQSVGPRDIERFRWAFVGFLFVLYEAWRMPHLRPGVERLRALAPENSIDVVLKEGEKDGSVAWMRRVRHHVFHLDKSGRKDPRDDRARALRDFPDRLFEAFSKGFLDAFLANRRRDLVTILRVRSSSTSVSERS